MHVLLLPKWYPGRNDPQLGDFLRKQALAVGIHVRMSVLHVEAITDAGEVPLEELAATHGAWELCVRYRASVAAFTPWRKMINLTRYWRAMQRGWERIVKERGTPDLLHAYILVRPVLFAWWKAQGHRLPFLISEQSSEYLDGTYASKGPFFKAINHFLFRRAAAVTVVSAWLGDAIVEHGLCSRYEVVPNVVPGLDRSLPEAGAPGHFLMVADLVDRTKNVSGALRALAMGRKTNPDLRLTIIGDGTDRRMLEDLTDELGLRGSVEFLGRVANTVVLDRMATIFAVIINSNVETFSVVTGEALAQGKPVIATRCGGPIAFINDVNGLLIDVKDDAALAAAMLELTMNAARYDPAVIRASVSEKSTPAAVGNAFYQVYRRILPHVN